MPAPEIESESRSDGSGGDGSTDPNSPDSGGFFVRTSLVFYGVMGCAAMLWRMALQGEPMLHPTADAAATAWGPLPALAAGALFGLLAVGSSELMMRWSQLAEALADLLGESLAGLGRGDAILLAAASGLAEEMLFRGAVQPAIGLVAASLVFGACHFLPRRELALWSLWAVVMGFAFGLLYEWTGHLAAPIAAHVLINGINLPRLARRFAERGVAGSDDSGGA